MSKVYSSMLLAICLLFPLQSHANLFKSVKKWVKSEAIPTIKGDRPLNIKPYVTLTSDENHIKFHVDAKDNFQLQIGDVKMSTHQFSLRLVQAGCIMTTGDIVDCAPDIFARELANVADRIDPSNPGSILAEHMPQYSVTPNVRPAYNVIPSGYIMQPCGCWGFNPAPVAYEPRCMSNRVVVGICPAAACYAGGQAYGYMCM